MYNTWVRIVEEPGFTDMLSTKYFTLPSGRVMKIMHDSSLDRELINLKYDHLQKAVSIGTIARTFLQEASQGNPVANETIRKGIKHEYTHAVIYDVFDINPLLPDQLYRVLSQPSYDEVGKKFAFALTQQSAYKDIFTIKNPEILKRKVLHELFAFASELEEPGTLPTSQLAQSAQEIMLFFQKDSPDMYAKLIDLGIVTNKDFNNDFPIILSHLQRLSRLFEKANVA